MITPPALLSDRLLAGREPRRAGDGVWSVMTADAPGQRYDRRAAAYDRVVGSALYNRILWGSSPRTYAAFAHRAVCSAGGPLLDAGCGSLVFTARAYATADRALVLMDQSVGMLQAARERLQSATDPVRDDIVLVQADLRDLPFRRGSFSTVLCMGMLHLFDDLRDVVPALARTVEPGGQLFVTSLVAETRIGARYLSLLHRAGEVASPRTAKQLLNELTASSANRFEPTEVRTEGSMAFIVGRTAR